MGEDYQNGKDYPKMEDCIERNKTRGQKIKDLDFIKSDTFNLNNV